jgi:hypothetical protein
MVVMLIVAGPAGCGPTTTDNSNDNTAANENGNDNGSVDGNDNSTDDANANTSDDGTGDISTDVTVETLTVAAGETINVRDDAVITVTGDATVDGTLSAESSRLTLIVGGDLTLGGTLTSASANGNDVDDTAGFTAQPTGVQVVVNGTLTMTENTVIQTDGHIVMTDDSDVLSQTPEQLFDEVEDLSADDETLSTFVPLPPDHEDFDDGGGQFAKSRHRAGTLPPITISGTWPNAGDPVPPGDRPVVVFRFNGNRDLDLTNWTVNSPSAPDGDDADPNMGTAPRPGKNGLRLNIWNNGGPINANNVVFNLADGGNGGDDSSACGTATGADGGKSGNFRMTASGGINFNGPVTINPGVSGSGGAATVTQGAAGAAGCPGADGDGADATGGRGAANTKRLRVRGTVNGLNNLTMGDLLAGDGGDATATACNGGDGIACCDGGPGGDATATGGAGGDASLNVGTLPINVGDVFGGDGGAATGTGGTGGNGGDCKFLDAGDGGDGGAATATSGAGGNASGGGIALGGDSGDASATGGNGGNGGDSGFGTPGAGGGAGAGTATSSAAGTGSQGGTVGAAAGNPGNPGNPGGAMAVTLWCVPVLNFVMQDPGPIDPGLRMGPVLSEDESTEVGQIEIEFVDTGTEFNYQLSNEEPPNVGIGDGRLDIIVDSLQLADGEAGVIGGIRVVPLLGFNISPERPLQVTAVDAEGQVLGTYNFEEIPNNVSVTEPQALEALFEVEASVAVFQIAVPFDAFVTIDRIYLLDP